MRALRGVVDARSRRRPGRPAGRRARRALTAGAVIVAAALASGGCAKFDAALGKQEAVVTFRDGTPQATMMKVRSACSRVPGATAEAIPPGANATNGVYDVRFRVDNASDADIAELEKCLSKFPSVQGINIEQEDGD